MRPEHKANGAKQAEFLDNVSKYKTIVDGLYFQRYVSFEIKITVSHCEIFLFHPAKNIQRILWKIISAEKKPTPTQKATAWYLNILTLVFQSFNVHFSLIYKKRPEHRANGAKQRIKI